jgi:hypothetical protein
MRRLAFIALAVAITTAALLLASRHERAAEAPAPAATARHRPTPRAAPPPNTPALRRAARGFIEAFLAAEAGAQGPATRTAIHRRAAPDLARDLLAHLPRRPGRSTAEILALQVARLPRRPDLALLNGTARRPGGPEPFAFLLARRGGRWLAIAPAE